MGSLELSCQILLGSDGSPTLLVHTAAPGSETYDRLQLLAVVGASPTS